MALVTEPIALDRSFNTTEQTPRNLADVLAQALQILNTTISGLNFINATVVQELPVIGISTTTIYLVPSDDPQSENIYDEYINLDGTSAGWEKIGSTKIDLSNYYTKAETDTLLSAKADTSDIPTVNDGTLTIQQNGETKGTFTANQSGNSTVNIETPTADIQTAVDEFETYNGGLLSECKVALSPNQDLHGYDHPWVGGAGKNLFPPTKFPINAFNGVTSSVSGDVLTLSGITTNANGYYFDQPDKIISLKAGTYTMSFSATGSWGTNSLKEVRLRKSDSTILLRLYDGSVNSGSITFNEDTDVFFAINAGANVPANENVNVSITVQLEAGSTATPYEPYENICPFSGHTQVDVDVSDGQTTQEQVTVNLGGTYYSGILDIVSGVFVVDKVKAVTPTRGALDSSGKLYTINFSSGIVHEYIDINIATPYVMCSHLDVDSLAGARETQRKCICQYARTAYIGGYVGEETELDNMLASADFSIVFELATPLTIQLTPQQVQALVGENHLSTPLDGQEITEVKYKKMFTFDDVIAYIQSLS